MVKASLGKTKFIPGILNSNNQYIALEFKYFQSSGQVKKYSPGKILFMAFNNVISWFEIPSIDLDRATRFYEMIFNTKLNEVDMPNIRMRMFPLEDMMTGVGGAVVDSNGFHRPSSTEGPLIYLNANPDVQTILNRVEAAGGHILVPKTPISPEYGFMAVIIDTEGNRVGLHSA